MDNIHLIGAEDVHSAGYTIKRAAEEMSQAVRNFDWALERHQRFLDDWLVRFETIMQPPKPMTRDEIVNSNTFEAQVAAGESMRKLLDV
jgi:hypothetical protein